jgi:DNA-binding FrmR family transcriptional regulator
VEKAIQQAKKALIQDHLDHCLEDLVGPLEAGQRQSMDEFREITRYL